MNAHAISPRNRTLLRLVLPLLSILFAIAASGQTRSPRNIDIAAPDGVKLRGTFFPAAKSGPGVLLLHMCNTTRQSWEPVARKLSEGGINALTLDNRGFGESGGPRFQGGTPEALKELRDKWPGDFDAAYEFLISQPNVDKSRIAVGGGSCGVNNAVKLAERHPNLNALVLLAGGTDLAGINYIVSHPELPLFTAGAADDQYNPATIELMRWFNDLSGNPRTRFSGFENGRHGTEIFGPHPELVDQIVAFLVDTLVTSPVDLRKPAAPRKTQASEFFALVNQPHGASKAAAHFRDARKRDPKAAVFPEFPMNLVGYAKLQAGDTQDAIELFKLIAEAYPTSANAQDSLSDAYLAAGQTGLALAAGQKCLELLPRDTIDPDFKARLETSAKEKIRKLKVGNVAH